jgi:hypothetical protein
LHGNLTQNQVRLQLLPRRAHHDACARNAPPHIATRTMLVYNAALTLDWLDSVSRHWRTSGTATLITCWPPISQLAVSTSWVSKRYAQPWRDSSVA